MILLYNKNMTKIIFPDNSSNIISRVTKDAGIKEQGTELFAKLSKGQKTNGEILAQLVKKAAEQEMSFKDLVSSIKESLGITQKLAEDIGKSLRKELILNVQKVEERVKQPKQVIIEKKRPPRKDGYRESVQ